MIPVLSRDEIRRFDQYLIERCAVPGIVLMENAGRGATEVVLEELARRSCRAPYRIVIVAGPGNNGGDGLVMARRLRLLGHRVDVCLSGTRTRLNGDALTNCEAYLGVGGAVAELGEAEGGGLLRAKLDSADAIVDALFGTGLDRPISGLALELVRVINEASVLRFCLDIPSGIDANTGAVLGAAVSADVTITFAHPKLGLLAGEAIDKVGSLRVVDIGAAIAVNEDVGVSARVLEPCETAHLVRSRPASVHKVRAGRVLGLSGSPGKSGAALLLARGALRGGAGLVTLAGLPATADALEQRVHEEMTARLDPDKLEDSLDDLLARTDVVAVGPGLGLDAQARRIVEHVVFRWSGRVVVDADALTLLASRFAELPKAKSRLLLTPHPGELGRLLASSAREIENDRFVALARAVEICQATVVLKGPRTLIGAPGQIPAVNTLASRALATGGSGDVLAGVCAAFSCELDPFQAACAAVQVHGFAGQRWSERTGAERGLVAREIADEIPAAIAGLASARGLLTL